MPYGHLAVAVLASELMPTVRFPVVEVLMDAYSQGLLPFGVYGQQLDPNYVGPNVLLCLNPANLA